MNRRLGAVILATWLLPACSQPAPKAAETAATSSNLTGIAPKNAIVTLLPAGGALPMPAEPAVMDQIAKQFVPAVLLVRVGQPVEFRNSEDIQHNVSVARRGTGAEILNVSTEPHQKQVYTFDRVGQFDVLCDMHEGMSAIIIAALGPTTTIAEDDGRFSFSNVAFGSYKLSLTFEGRTVERPLAVTGARTEFQLSR